MNSEQPLIDLLFRERVVRARGRSPGERMSEALELSAAYFSGNDAELKRRLAIVRELEERDCYGPPQPRL